MSINNINLGSLPMSQMGHPATGPIFMIANQHHPSFAYFLQRNYLDGSQPMQAPQTLQGPQAIHHRMIQPQIQQPSQHQHLQLPSPQHLNNNNHPQQQQLQLPLPQPRQVQVQPPAQSKDQTNSKIKNIKEKCLTHYIDGQLIIETSKPLAEKKLKSAKKKKSHLQNQQHENGNNISMQSISNNSNQINNHQQQQPQMLNNQPMQIQQQPPPPTPPQPQLPPPQPQPQPQIQPLPIQAPHTQPNSVHRLPQPLVQTLQQQQPQPRPQLMQSPTQHRILVPQQPTPPPKPPKPPSRQTQSTNNHNTGLDEVQRLRAEMPNWSVTEVVEFIERHEDIRQYSSKFSEDEVDGKALLLMIDRNLNFQMLTLMFKHGPAMKIEATLSKYKIND